MAEVEVITIKQMQELDRLLVSNPEMKRKVHKVLASVLQKARTQISKDSRNVLNSDPRQAYRAVKRTVYKRILGGAVSILNKRKASSTRVSVQKERKLQPGQRGGNRRKRSERTDQLDSYFGADRGFILRFVNAGTRPRFATHYGHASRGNIAPRNWFSTSSQKAMEAAAQQFCDLIDKEIENINKHG